MKSTFRKFVLLAGLAMTLALPGVKVLAASDPIPGIDIIVKKKPGGIPVHTTSGEDGSFHLKNQPAGNYTISIGKKAVQSIDVGSDGKVVGKLENDGKGGISYTVDSGGKSSVGSLAFDGDPIPGVDIKLGKNPGGIPFHGHTNPNGGFNFPKLEPGNYDLSIAGQTFQNIPVGKEGVVSGTLSKGTEGKALITINGYGPFLFDPVVGAAIVTSRSNIKHPIIFVGDNRPTRKMYTGPGDKGGDTEGSPTLREAGSGMATGRRQYQPLSIKTESAADPNNGAGEHPGIVTPISGIPVGLDHEPDSSIIFVQTDKNGAFQFENLPEGKYKLSTNGLPEQSVIVGSDGTFGGKLMRDSDGQMSIYDRWGNHAFTGTPENGIAKKAGSEGKGGMADTVDSGGKSSVGTLLGTVDHVEVITGGAAGKALITINEGSNGHEIKIPVFSQEPGVGESQFREAGSGMATGRRQYKPLSIKTESVADPNNGAGKLPGREDANTALSGQPDVGSFGSGAGPDIKSMGGPGGMNPPAMIPSAGSPSQMGGALGSPGGAMGSQMGGMKGGRP